MASPQRQQGGGSTSSSSSKRAPGRTVVYSEANCGESTAGRRLISAAAWRTSPWSKGTSPAQGGYRDARRVAGQGVLGSVQGRPTLPCLHAAACAPRSMEGLRGSPACQPQSLGRRAPCRGASPDCILSSSWCSSETREMSIFIALCMLPRCAFTAQRGQAGGAGQAWVHRQPSWPAGAAQCRRPASNHAGSPTAQAPAARAAHVGWCPRPPLWAGFWPLDPLQCAPPQTSAD